MSYAEPPPVYSSLSEVDRIYFRGEEKKSLFLSPFTARKEPKKFAVFHIVASSLFFMIGVGWALSRLEQPIYSFDRFARGLIIIVCLPPLPAFAMAYIGIKKNWPNFMLPIAAYMIIAFALLCLQLIAFLGITIFNAYDQHAWMLAIGWISLGSTSIPLLYTSHATRLYLRVRYDILDEEKERKEEKKRPLIV